MAVGNPAPGFYPTGNANVGYIKDLFIKWTSGGSGAVTALPFGEIVSITNTGTGAYTIQFSQAYNGSRNFYGNIAQAAGYSSSGVCRVNRVYDANESTNGTLKVLFVNGAGTATELLNGDVVELTFQVATATGYP